MKSLEWEATPSSSPFSLICGTHVPVAVPWPSPLERREETPPDKPSSVLACNPDLVRSLSIRH
jgi:hypothetical protein